jgi:hypothetical protein
LRGSTCSRVFNQQFRADFVSSPISLQAGLRFKRGFVSSTDSFQAQSKRSAVLHGSGLWLAPQHAKMMNEIAVRRKRRSDAVSLIRR